MGALERGARRQHGLSVCAARGGESCWLLVPVGEGDGTGRPGLGGADVSRRVLDF